MFQRKLKEKEEKKIAIEKWNNILPILLFLVVLVNYIPVFKLNFNVKQSFAADVVALVTAFGIECFILALFYLKRIKLSKPVIINFIAILIVTIISSVIQIINYKNNSYEIMDFANIACKFVNIILLFVLAINIKIDEKYLNYFMKLIICVGIIACIQNMILYFEDIMAHLNLIELERKASIPKSFFSQKNPFAFFLYISIISTIFLFQKENKIFGKIVLGLTLLLFLFNVVLTFSRTGTAMVIMFLGLWFLFTNKISVKVKVILAILGVIGVGICIPILNQHNPDLLNRILRLESVKTFTGRTKFWDIAKEEILSNPVNLIFGVGRFKAENLIEKYNVTQFHNTYVEFLVSGGIIELIYFLGIYVFVLVKTLKSKIDKKYKSIYLAMFISFAVYMLFESLGRFSIGSSDTMCLVFFITIPLLHSNCHKNDIVEEKEVEE